MLGDQPIINKEALDATHTPVIVNGPPSPTIADPASFYGLGWNIEMTPYGEVQWSHSGAFSVGASTVAKLIPGEGLGIVVLTNSAPVGVPEGIAEAYFNYLHSIPVTDDEVFALWQQRLAGSMASHPTSRSRRTRPQPGRTPPMSAPTRTPMWVTSRSWRRTGSSRSSKVGGVERSMDDCAQLTMNAVGSRAGAPG